MSNHISMLPQQVANQIAAGEVIQRPASAVKELVENALDANAKHIQILIKQAGKSLIKIVDNGSGIEAEDFELAFERHATSKIKKIDDIFNIYTKGFRGEALASIAAVAQVEAVSRTESSSVGTLLVIEGGKCIKKEVIATEIGTSISVKNLFFNTPARRNFLKSNHTEKRHIMEEIYRVAIPHCDVRFDLKDHASELMQLPIATLKIRLKNIFGRNVSDNLLEVKSETNFAKIWGYVLKPKYSKKKGSPQYFFVNKRFIRNSYLRHAIITAFQGLLPEGHMPGYFIFLDIPPNKLDVNIHPTKTEIKFEEAENLYAILLSTVKHSLGIHQVAPSIDFHSNPEWKLPYSYKDKDPIKPVIQHDPNYNPFGGQNIASPSSQNNYEEKKTKRVISSMLKPINTIDSEADSKTSFQLFSKFIVRLTTDNMIIIDQQRAHQRIIYDKIISTSKTNRIPSQQLIFPIILSLSLEQIQIIKESEEILENVGFRMKIIGSTSLQIVGAPQLCPIDQIRHTIEKIIDTELTPGAREHNQVSKLIAETLAKEWTGKNPKSMSEHAQRELIEQLFECDESLVSPFGKRIIFTFDRDYLIKKFD